MVETKPLLFFDEARFRADLAARGALPVFRDALAAANAHFDNRFLEGERVDTLVVERAAFVDRILAYAWELFPWDEDVALLAVGGYGRCELHPHSDIDLLILLPDGGVERHRASIERFLAFLWDIQLKIGQSVRTLDECVEEARADVTVATNLMESRTLCGDPALRRAMMERTGPDRIWPPDEFFRAKRAEQQARHRKHGDTEYSLEPNVKESPGGLRDIQMIQWVARRHFGVDSLEGLVECGFLDADELHFLKTGRSFLWKVRYGLHYLARRAEERLTFDHQRRLAELFGYRDSDERLGVEQFMQQYYRVVTGLRELNDVLLQYLDEVILHRDRLHSLRPLNERFQVRDGHIEAIHPRVFADHPSALLEIFVLLGENPEIEGIRATTIREIQRWRHLIDDGFRNDPANTALFLRLLRCPGKLTPQLQRMARYGVLGRYLPEFGRITGQVQHDLFHIYPVDVHTLEVIRNLRRLDRPEMAERYPLASHIYKNLPKPELLFIAGLYHDIAKGRGGDHSLLGAADVEGFARRHGLPEQEVELLRWLVEHHLLMSQVAQREDTSDPAVIQRFARMVGDQLRLDYLYVLTVADITATNPSLWNSWRDALLRTLYEETRQALARGLENPVNRREWVAASREEALHLLAQRGIPAERAQAVWADVDEEFFLRERPRVIARCTEAILQAPEGPMVYVEDAGLEFPSATRVFVYTRGGRDVFLIAAATLDQLNLNIQDARLSRTSAGHTFDMFYVLDEEGRPFGQDRARVERVRQTLAAALSDPHWQVPEVKRRTPRRLKQLALKTAAYLYTEASGGLTALEVITPDRPGLLAHLGRIFARFGIRLHRARIATLGERVEDVFYITDAAGRPLSDPDFCRRLETAIREELDQRNREDAGGAPLVEPISR